ncbi:MAG TPA: MCE family protein [Jatrophihabitans sp.]|jgi:phospholipid/cholesterol/gamma-HCH transport system substrate-binding protein
MRQHFARDFAVGCAYLVLIAALIAVSIMAYRKDFTSSMDVSLQVPDAGTQLQTGADVEVRGVVVGSVDSISSTGSGARIALALDPGHGDRLPANVTAQLLPKTLFGQRYVALVLPASPSPEHLHDGATIEADTSATGAELQDVFAHLLRVLQAVRPAQLAQTLGAFAAALRNEGDAIGATIDELARYLRKFAPRVPQLTDDITRFASVAHTYSQAAPDLLQALRNFTVTNRTLVAERGQFVDLLNSVTDSSNRLTDFTAANSANLIELSRSSRPTLQVLARYSSEFPCLSRSLVDFIPVMDRALGAGTDEPGLHVTLQVVPGRQPYTGAATRAADAPPRCPQLSVAAANSPAVGAALARGAGIGTDNSPQENQVIAELVAPGTGRRPDQFPKWGSLLLGPALRGAQVSVK